MKRLCVILGLSAGIIGSPACALDLDPSARVKAIAAAAPVAVSTTPTNPSRVSLPDMHGGLDTDGRSFSGACGAAKSDLCYDHREGRIVIRSTRNYMPEIAGLKPEHISLRKDRITFRYSFK